MNSIQLVIKNEIHDVAIKEYCGQRVVTFRDVDVLHKSANGAARKNFNYNKERFIEGEDYFVVNYDEAKELFGITAPKGVTLVTESGYLMLVKSLNDDLAWMVQRELIKTYFKAKEHFATVEVVPVNQQPPTTIEDILTLAFSGLSEMKKKLDKLEDDNRKLTLVVDNEVHVTDQQCALIQEAVKNRVGQLMKQGYEAHFQSIFSALKIFFTVPKYNKIRRGDFDKAIDFIKGWYPKKDERVETN